MSHNKKTKEDYRKLAAEKGFRWLGEDLPKNTKTRTKWECLKRRHRTNHTWKSMKENRNCRECYWEDKRDSSQFDRRTKEGRAAYAQFWRRQPGNSERTNATRREKHAAYRAENPLPPPRTEEEIAAQKAAWLKADREAHPIKYKRKHRKYYAANKNEILEKQSIWRDEKRDEIYAKAAAIRRKYPDKHRSAGKKYRQENPEKNAARRAKRRAFKKQCTPCWADMEAVEFFYECRPKGCEVDHIFPLQADDISGLHVPENLQWLPWLVNRHKGNYWSDDPKVYAKYMHGLVIKVLRSNKS